MVDHGLETLGSFVRGKRDAFEPMSAAIEHVPRPTVSRVTPMTANTTTLL